MEMHLLFILLEFMTMGLNDITDFYISEDDPAFSFYYPGPHMAEGDMLAIAGEMLNNAKNDGSTDFITTVRGVRFRSARIPSVRGNYYIFRKMPNEVWTLDKCGISTVVKKMIIDERLNKGGLIIVSGMPGNGKSTTCSAIISERLRIHSGVCNTIEDPAEMPLHGFHGDGFCIQREVSRGEDSYEAVVDTLRAYPAKQNTMLLIGEVRDSSTAALALQSAVDGRLVLITTHAGDVIETARRIINLASGPGGIAYEQARELFAAAFRLIIHQKLINDKLRLSVMADTQQASAVLRGDSDLTQLKNSLVEQGVRIKKGVPLELRRV